LLEQLLGEVPPGVERAEVLLALAGPWRGGDPETLTKLCEKALIEAATADDVLHVRILTDLSRNRGLHADMPGALAASRAALERAERIAEPRLLARAIAQAGNIEKLTLQTTPGLLERGVAIEEHLESPLASYESPRAILATCLMLRDDIERARLILEEAEHTAAVRGDEGSRVYALIQLMTLEWLAGRWHRTNDHAAAATELAEQAQWDVSLCWGLLGKAVAAAYLGRVEQARATLAEVLSIQTGEWFAVTHLGVLGQLELALGNLEAAGRHLRELPGRPLYAGCPDGPFFVWPDAIETLVGLGARERAGAYLERYEELAPRSSRRAMACAARCRGLFAASEGDLAIALESLDAASAEHARLPYPYEHARSLLALGRVRRQARQKRAAREALAQAHALFEQLGARLWAQKARAELGRISGRRTGSDELTETERQVANLAGQGRSTKEIAAELFMSTHTVGAHLTRIYRKLGIRSRAALAHRLGAATDGTATGANEPAKL
jgi:DNA-binding CsgD family transcriptional regulator